MRRYSSPSLMSLVLHPFQIRDILAGVYFTHSPSYRFLRPVIIKMSLKPLIMLHVGVSSAIMSSSP